MNSVLRVICSVVFVSGALAVYSMSARALIERDNKGPAVKVLQQKLKSKGYFKSTANGTFGPKTEEAVEKFQRAKGLKADGKVGDVTWRKLTGAAKKPILEEGKGPAVSVKTLQRKLGLKQDGKFGKGTTAALKKYQKRQGITADGTVESDTRYMMKW